ncbi:3-hydroxyacyl-CoA dehydrogenase NAD-binding domain-containing protein [Candidatus Pelagadaptatus aseana]|uniref:3-hydroxyacyl-CoA dehydrogenase NAD-binding domain-containing protein n=1 Tax=Candidatus Pelagadaptatus aseana TaxID=3120508 RepID=UPI003C6F96CD
MSVFKYEKDADGIVTVTMDMTGPVNAMNAEYDVAMNETVDKLEAEQGLTGVVFASAKSTFFAGGDLNMLLAVKEEETEEFFNGIVATKDRLRRLEKLPVPVVAAINGAALGGGFEICLSCNHRIALNSKAVQVGLPEVSLGLLPGGGGVVRMVNLLGLTDALPYLLEGKKVDAAKALKAGLVHETVESLDELVPRAKAWILENKDSEEAAQQPWDRKGFRIPGGNANSPKLAQTIMMAPAMLRQKTRGLLPAPEMILDAATEAARLGFDNAQMVEARNFAYLACKTPQAKNMITTFFFQLNQVNGGGNRPKDVEKSKVAKVGILGAGMMGQGIAYSSAMSGIEVVLKDISQEAADKGKAYSEKLLDKRIARGRMTEEKKADILGLITATADDADLQGCDLIIEAVFENMELKHKITKATEGYLADNGVWGSNTSTLPITQLAEGSSKPENFIGIHFFSPVDKMPLVEIICGEKTSDETLARAFDYVRQIKKTPIVVNDSLGFFTSRTFGTYIDEGIRLVQEGVHPIQVDNMGKAIGMPVGSLTVHDETSQQLSHKVISTQKDMGLFVEPADGDAMTEMVNWIYGEHNRGGRHHGGGYFDYAADGSKTVWQPLVEKYYKEDHGLEEQDMKDRLLFRSVVETLKCLQEGVLRSVADGNIGSIMGIGAPVWTGGYLQFINTYGAKKFVARCKELQAKYGNRFEPPAIVVEKAESGELFS